MTAPVKRPLAYRTPAPAEPSPWRAVGRFFCGLFVGLATAVAILISLSVLFPSRSQASTGSTYLFFGGIASVIASVPVSLGRRWFLGGILAGTGATSAFLGFAIGILSGINC